MTFQAREQLEYQGQRRTILALPLTGCGRKVPDFGVLSSACWRGYRGTWAVRDDALHLIELAPPYGAVDDSDLQSMFGRHSGSVEATWFSGQLIPDDLADPSDADAVEMARQVGRSVQFLSFVLIVRQGKLLLERSLDLQSGALSSRITDHVEGLFPPQEVAFLRAIQEDLNDPVPKLVYADWLEEQVDERCLLLREEVARRREKPSRRLRFRRTNRQDVPTGHVEPVEVTWFWQWLADLPAQTEEERSYVEMLRRLGMAQAEDD